MKVSMAIYRAVQELINLGEGGDAWESALHGLRSFTEWRELVPLLINVPLAALLMAPIIYTRRRKKRTYDLSTVEEDKALILYAAVSAAVAVLVLEHPAMALVVFGMGGLIRFRTRVGSGLGTVRAISAVVIGLACGLGMYALALMLAVMGLIGARVVAPRSSVEIKVKKIDPALFEESREAYHRRLKEAGCIVAGVRPSPANDQFIMVVVLPEGLSPEGLNDAVFQRITEKLRGRAHVELGD